MIWKDTTKPLSHQVHVFQINSKRIDGKLLLLEISKSHNCSSVACLKCVQLHDNGIAHVIESVQNVSCFSAVFFRRAVEIEPFENVVILKHT